MLLYNIIIPLNQYYINSIEIKEMDFGPLQNQIPEPILFNPSSRMTPPPTNTHRSPSKKMKSTPCPVRVSIRIRPEPTFSSPLSTLDPNNLPPSHPSSSSSHHSCLTPLPDGCSIMLSSPLDVKSMSLKSNKQHNGTNNSTAHEPKVKNIPL